MGTAERPTFKECFCAQHELAEERFATVVFRKTLYPHARWLRGIIGVFDAEFFRADLDYVADVARVRRLRDMSELAADYFIHPGNRGVAKRLFNLRVSTYRMSRLVRRYLHSGDSGPPFTGPGERDQPA